MLFRSIPKVLQELGTAGVLGHMLIVDDNSPDGTGLIVEELSRKNSNIHVIHRAKKIGIGSAYLEGFRWALAKFEPDVFIQMDADLSHPPPIVKELIRCVSEEYFHVAIASRYVAGGAMKGWPFTRRMASFFANLIARILLRLDVSDATGGYRALSDRKSVV